MALFLLTITTLNTAPLYAETLSPLPEPVSNNAVAIVNEGNTHWLLSFSGLGTGKQVIDVHNKAWALPLTKNAKWQRLPPVPHIEPLLGRLAAIAVGIKNNAYLFGGYTVARDHTEVSTKDNYRFNINTKKYTRIADMPVPVDDTAAFSYQNRYIYLLSGWHQTGNVNLVQVYDTQTDSWAQATPLPIPATFGLSAGIVGNQLVVCDGVKTAPQENEKRKFVSSPQCLYGIILPNNHLKIEWLSIPHYVSTDKLGSLTSSTAHYRMAAAGVKNAGSAGQIIFIGGSDNPYNYSGIGYNGTPSPSSNLMHRFDLATHQWKPPLKVTRASMDHRGLIVYDEMLIRIGGMTDKQQVTDQLFIDPVPELWYK
ncbi:galactose oxidase [Parashewanella spongiae]|uniref:Galactose oxidase n=2 Tax=Parashewanella spongiae TaxID=342950 RepID=A0A3A6TKC1_9GAMM|nr:galactose oxidase [Parashewanella spongiae]